MINTRLDRLANCFHLCKRNAEFLQKISTLLVNREETIDQKSAENLQRKLYSMRTHLARELRNLG